MEKITAGLLRQKGACKDQVEKFQALFPVGVIPTRALCLEHAQVFVWVWAANHLLSASAQAAYDKATESAWTNYNKARASAWANYEQDMVSTRTVRNKTITPAYVAYQRAMASARAAYNKATALAWANAAELE